MGLPVVVERNLLIPLPDGVRLAADHYRPAGTGRWPAIADFLPYYQDGRGGRLDVEAVNRHFVARRYAALTVDFRRVVSSDAVNRLPFDPQEARDGREVSNGSRPHRGATATSACGACPGAASPRSPSWPRARRPSAPDREWTSRATMPGGGV